LLFGAWLLGLILGVGVMLIPGVLYTNYPMNLAQMPARLAAGCVPMGAPAAQRLYYYRCPRVYVP
jgi:hypothetical protein